MQKKLAIPLLALAFVGVGGTAYTLSHSGPITAHAQSVQQTQSTSADKPESANDPQDAASEQKQAPSYTSSIRVADQANDQETNDGTEAQQLAKLAKISSDQAKAAAEKSAGGTASSVKLENENGNVVYAVTVGQKEVKVDAGNGSVLHTETAEAGDSGETGSAESN